MELGKHLQWCCLNRTILDHHSHGNIERSNYWYRVSSEFSVTAVTVVNITLGSKSSTFSC